MIGARLYGLVLNKLKANIMRITKKILDDRLSQVNNLGFNLTITYQNGYLLLRTAENMNYLTPSTNKEVYNYLEGVLLAIQRIKDLNIKL